MIKGGNIWLIVIVLLLTRIYNKEKSVCEILPVTYALKFKMPIANSYNHDDTIKD